MDTCHWRRLAWQGLLASGSWDSMVRVWDVFNNGTQTETYSHTCVRARAWPRHGAIGHARRIACVLCAFAAWAVCNACSRECVIPLCAARRCSPSHSTRTGSTWSRARATGSSRSGTRERGACGRRVGVRRRGRSCVARGPARREVTGTIDGRRDAVGGRRVADVRTAKSSAAAKCFTSCVPPRSRARGVTHTQTHTLRAPQRVLLR